MNNKYSGWKQPIPTDIRQNTSIDILSRMLFYEILSGCQNSDYHIVYYHGNKRIDLELKRGQFLFVVTKYANELKIDRRIIEKCLKVINEWYTELLIERKAFGLVITIKDYDEIVKMQNEMSNEMSNESKSKVNRMQIESKSKNKSDKIVESDKSIKETIPKGIGEAPFKVNETLKPKQIKKDKRNPQITEILDYLKDKIGYLDDSETWNRRYASSLLKRLKKQYPDKDPIATARALIDIGLADEFHSKNLTNFRYLFNNQQKILRGFKDNRKNIIIID
jgi:hypothetical protein